VVRALTVSEYLSNANPNTSNPAPRFAVEQKALPTACVRMALIARSRLIAKLAADKRGLVPLYRVVATTAKHVCSYSGIMGEGNFVTLNIRILGVCYSPKVTFPESKTESRSVLEYLEVDLRYVGANHAATTAINDRVVDLPFVLVLDEPERCV
jgi:hypothetical protein